MKISLPFEYEGNLFQKGYALLCDGVNIEMLIPDHKSVSVTYTKDGYIASNNQYLHDMDSMVIMTLLKLPYNTPHYI